MLTPPRSRLPLLLLPLLLLGCTGNQPPGDRAGTVNWTLKVEPSAPTLMVGQTLQFRASTPWGGEALWSVLPTTAGTITPTGLFTAGVEPGTCTVLAVWKQDIRYAASASVRVLAAPPTAVVTPNLVQCSGGQQTTASGQANGVVLGEPVPATTALSTSQAIQVRHGFEPPGNP